MWGRIPKFDILLHAKSEKKKLSNWICTPIIFKNPIKTCFYIKKFMSGAFGLYIYFLFEKQAFNGLLKVIDIQILFEG